MKVEAIAAGLILLFIGGGIGLFGYSAAESMNWLERLAYPDRYDTYILMFWVGSFLGIIGLIVTIVGAISEEKQPVIIYSPPGTQIQTQYPGFYQTQPYQQIQFSGYSPANFPCPYCRSQLWWSDQYHNYYCSQCKKFIPATQDSIDEAIGSIKKEFNK